MNKAEHYFDWAATSPADEGILREALEKTLENWGNPSSVHQIGKNARNLLEEARNNVCKVLGVKSDSVYFTSGGTESDQIVLLSMLNKLQKGTILVSSIEHPAIREQAAALKKTGWNIVSIPADKYGIITPDAVEQLLTDDTMLVCVMAVNNETGSIQPVYQIADLITEKYKGKRKPKFHVDCVQAAGKIPLNLNYSGIDSAALSAHKICGPRGIGILYMKDVQEAFLRGGGQEKGIRSGTENVFGALAFSKCLEKYFILNETSKTYPEFTKQKTVTENFVKNLSELKGCTIVPEGRLEAPDNFSPYVVQAAFDKIPGNVMLRALDAKGFCISTGSACSTKKANRPVLEAMHVPANIRETAVRFSFGPITTEESIEELFEEIRNINSTFNK
ncbi:MAG: cysteine desulfurase family protein [Treponema sp.]|nr:cysteine desulfurase [Spirochaetia bacterium]MDY2840382.1 cysteine desulfurase family protein [Treponema sp.]